MYTVRPVIFTRNAFSTRRAVYQHRSPSRFPGTCQLFRKLQPPAGHTHIYRPIVGPFCILAYQNKMDFSPPLNTTLNLQHQQLCIYNSASPLHAIHRSRELRQKKKKPSRPHVRSLHPPAPRAAHKLQQASRTSRMPWTKENNSPGRNALHARIGQEQSGPPPSRGSTISHRQLIKRVLRIDVVRPHHRLPEHSRRPIPSPTPHSIHSPAPCTLTLGYTTVTGATVVIPETPVAKGERTWAEVLLAHSPKKTGVSDTPSGRQLEKEWMRARPSGRIPVHTYHIYILYIL